MSLPLLTLVAAAGGLGAAVRFLLDGALRGLLGERLPWGTLVINATGSLALGVVLGLAGDPVPDWAAVAGSGFLGGYTTFSTASLETVRLLQRRRWAAAAAAGPGQLVGAVVLAAAGLAVGRLLGGGVA